MKKAAVLLSIVLSALSAPAALAVEYGDFPSGLQLILDERIAVLGAEGGMCIAGQVSFSDGASITSGADVMVNFYEGWDEPMWVYDGGWFIMGRVGSSSCAGPDKGMVLRAFGYDPIDASATVLDGEMTYLEFVMAKTPPENLATVEGLVVNESNIPYVPGARVSISFPFANHGTSNKPYMSMIPDGHGQYSFEGLSICEHKVIAYAPDYAYHRGLFTPPAGGTAVENRKLYHNRAIVIDYVYQADGSRDFTGGDLQTGTIEWLNGEGGVDFSEGQVEEYEPDDLRDLEMYQDQDILNFTISYSNGQNGFYDAGLTDFDDIAEAAEAGYGTSSQPCKVGHVYIVRTYEGNYAKFVVTYFQSVYRVVYSEFCDPLGWPTLDFPGFGLSLLACFFDPSPFPGSNGAIGAGKFSNDIVGLGGGVVPYVWEIAVSPDEGWRVDMTIIYDEADITSLGLSEDELVLFRSFNNGSSWERLDSIRDTQNNTLLVEDVISFSWFIIGTESTQIIPKTIYVDASQPEWPPWPDPPLDGLSWETAYRSLEDGLAAANEGDQVWVAEGTYEPSLLLGQSPPDIRAATFQLKSGVAIYGGFPAGGGDWTDRDPDLYVTILDGSDNNNYHVVTGSGTDETSILDGVTITGGRADGIPSEPTYHGGGMYNDNGSPTLVNCIFDRNSARRSPGLYNCNGSDPNIINCTFTRNQPIAGTVPDMGALYSENSNPTVTNCTFIDNFSTGMFSQNSDSKITNCSFVDNEGTGMDNNQSNLTIVSCTFTDNSGVGMWNFDCEVKVTDCNFIGNGVGMTNYKSDSEVVNCTFFENGDLTNDAQYEIHGAGMGNYECAPVVTNCIFTGNKADFGGAMSNGWGAKPVLVNCTFNENHAWVDGGGIYNEEEQQFPELGSTKPVLIECTFSNNSAIKHGGGMYSWDSDPNLTDCEFIGNWAKGGGGGMCNYRDCTLSMVNCTFTENSKPIGYSEFGGGGILCLSTSILNMNNCIFTRNSSGYDSGGGGAINVFNERSLVTAENCRFDTNFAEYGGGILNGGQLNLINCTFSENLSWSGWQGGGAIYGGGVLTIDNCIFSKNISRNIEHGYGGFGGALFCSYSQFTITNSIFIDNSSLNDEDMIIDDNWWELDAGCGGAVCTLDSSGVIDNCLFTGNFSGIGGGLYLESGYEPEDIVLVNNCTVVGNSALWYGGGLLLDRSVDVTNCIIRDNRAVLGPQVATWWAWEGDESRISYCDVEGGEGEVFLWDIWDDGALIDWGEGNIDADPDFVEAGWWDPNGTPTDPNDDFWVDGDYRLQPASPCIDAGDNSVVDPNSTDLDGNPRIIDGNDDDDRVVDMGAYEYWKYARNLADLNGDGVVDYRDFVLLASNWMEENCPVSAWCSGCDLNYSGKVDSIDLFRVARSWLWEMETAPDLDLDLDNLWMYQNLPGWTASNLTAAVSIAYDPLNNSSYTYEWEFILPDDVTVAPTITVGGGAAEAFCTFAAPDCDQPGGISDSGQTFTVRVTVTGDNFGNSAQAEAQFGIALLGDVNNDTVVNLTDRIIIDEFWRTGSAESYTLRDCNVDAVGTVNVVDKIIATEVWRGKLGSASVTTPCPFR